jgi:DNA repair protein RadC
MFLGGNMSFTVRDLPVYDRPRERLCAFGSGSLSVQELIAIVVSSGSPKRSVLNITQDLLSHFDSLNKLNLASIKELCAVPGIGKATAARIKAVLELGSRFKAEEYKPKSSEILNSEAAYQAVSSYLRGKKKEHLILFCLDVRNRLITEPEVVSVGTLDCSVVHPREVFSSAIKNLASKIIIAHNHPSESSNPSAQDLEITKQLWEAGNVLGIPLVDHLVITSKHYCSIRERYPDTFKTESTS